jgi:hypothetical protein
MKGNEAVKNALRKLDWIARLSKATCPAGVPEEPKAVLALLNRIVLDVRAVCRELEKALSDKSDRSDASDRKGRERKPGLIPVHGGYRSLRSFQVAELV